jgi:cell division septum initiation protein DivIVA|tara:strand:+ start:275 stop:421 length:147 start_codon:yes stop_codon:yes gene_type:complete
MYTVYEEQIEKLEEENEELRKEVLFLKKQLEYKSLGLPKMFLSPHKDS